MIPTDSIARYCVVVFLAANPAQAQTHSQKLAFCDVAGDLAEATTTARDAGVPIDQAQALAAGVDVDAASKEFFSALITLTYTMQGVEGPLMKQVAVQMCQKNMGLK
jgi:hypothetical protein